ncbi:MAG: 1-acyl-sn-glycerol-3-phosphate acyltransferase [Paludibacter sp.]|nr:1-acyl-sn-glycerol-3-phosphate acyltransferase [Paludibacter sp.]MDD4198312.1 1-acyl-sn-glycerol-3-phosphate acyltransferase [Paludibacter sp.]MDD4426924.1 1-acyl-sn-glycerol-3-phosphate acyltransferase [Paludibacter sp.]
MNFDSIRCYHQEEVPATLERLSNEKQFVNILSTIYPLLPKEVLKQRLTSFDNTDDFQKIMVYPFLQYIEANLTKGIELQGVDQIDKKQPYLYISNHRDIILDSSLLCGKLLEHGMDTVEIAIGDNLLVFPWIEDLVRMNKSFIVRRNPGAKQMLESSQLLSSYIAHTINEKKHSIWIAQREGRAKDADDRTQESLLKMFNMGGTGTFAENLAALHICPLSISYEYDPCDYLKAKEFQQKRDNPQHKKTPEDDLLNMKTGVMGYKGKVIYRIAGEITEEILQLGNDIQNRNELAAAIASLIDAKIHSNYEIYKVNLIAYDILNESTTYNKSYSLLEKLDFEKYLEMQIKKINLENKDVDFLKIRMLEMYANPFRNALLVNS